jgi:hypothetical protein
MKNSRLFILIAFALLSACNFSKGVKIDVSTGLHARIMDLGLMIFTWLINQQQTQQQ